MPTPIVLGITGAIGSGKSLATALLRAKGAEIIDADRLAHQYLEPQKPTFQQVVEEFGSDILDQDGTIIRSRLAEKVFRDSSRLEQLNRIIHPVLTEEIHGRISRFRQVNQTGILAVDAALIFQWEMQEAFDWVLWIDAPFELRLERLVSGGKISPEEFARRDKVQREWFEQVPSSGKIIRILNTGSQIELENQIMTILQKVVNDANQKHNQPSS